MKAQSGRGGKGAKRTSVPPRVKVGKNSGLAKSYRNPSNVVRDESRLSQRGASAGRKKASRPAKRK